MRKLFSLRKLQERCVTQTNGEVGKEILKVKILRSFAENTQKNSLFRIRTQYLVLSPSRMKSCASMYQKSHKHTFVKCLKQKKKL